LYQLFLGTPQETHHCYPSQPCFSSDSILNQLLTSVPVLTAAVTNQYQLLTSVPVLTAETFNHFTSQEEFSPFIACLSCRMFADFKIRPID
jgi:hypothetical protein